MVLMIAGLLHRSFVVEREEETCDNNSVVAFDLGMKTLATSVNERGKVYRAGGFKEVQWYNCQHDNIRSKHDRCEKGSRRYKHLSQVYMGKSRVMCGRFHRNRKSECECFHHH
jgi:putative transposase